MQPDRRTSRRTLLGDAARLASLVASAPIAAVPTPSTGDEPWNAEAPSDPSSAKIVARAAIAFLAALDASQRSKAAFANLADPARTQWSNFPAGAAPRPGVAIADLTDAQRVLLHELLRASTSSQGYLKMTGAIRADDVLRDLQGGDALFGAGNYYASVYGAPTSKNWAWMLTGHHMSAVFTISGTRTAFTPMFTGAQPLQIPTGTLAGWQALPHDAGRAALLLTSLMPDQRGVAVLSADAPGDVFAGPGRQDSLATFAGIVSGKLDGMQQRLLWNLVVEFVSNADAEAAQTQLALVRDGWKQTHFAWMGPAPSRDARFYFRVHGPRILIEYDVQEPLARNGGHVHAVTRDPFNDYGIDWLGLHYREATHAPGGPPGLGPPPPKS